MSCVAQEKLDATHKMVVLDALSTFVEEAEPAGREYNNFRCQEALDENCARLLNPSDPADALTAADYVERA